MSRSVFARGDVPGTSFFRLWLTYYRQLLSAIPLTQRIVTHYQSYFQDARTEAQRVAGWLNLRVSDELLIVPVPLSLLICVTIML